MGSVRLVVALPAEAHPLVHAWRLHVWPDLPGPFPTYRSFSGDRWLVVSGIGRTAAAAATGWLAAVSGSRAEDSWVNTGIAGHAEMDLGEVRLADKITDASLGKSWYPPIVFSRPCPSHAVVTVDRPEKTLSTGALYDMEAAGYYAAATRFATRERVHCVKVVSDHGAAPAKRIPASRIHRWMGAAIPVLDQLFTDLEELDCRAGDDQGEAMERFTGAWHFTASEQHQLRNLLRRWQALAMDDRQGTAFHFARDVRHATNAKEVMQGIADAMRTIRLSFVPLQGKRSS